MILSHDGNVGRNKYWIFRDKWSIYWKYYFIWVDSFYYYSKV